MATLILAIGASACDSTGQTLRLQVVNVLQRDPQLVHEGGPHKGKHGPRTEGTVSVQTKTLIRPPVMLMATNMRHVVQLVLPLTQFVATLSGQLSWSDFVNLLPLKRVDKHERQPGEEAPIGQILCAESRTELPPKAELGQKLHAALLDARERLARRRVLLGDLDDE